MTNAHFRLESIEDLFLDGDELNDAVENFKNGPYIKPGDLDTDRLSERFVSLESFTEDFVSRLLALESRFNEAPTPEGSPEGTSLVMRLEIVQNKAPGSYAGCGLRARMEALEAFALPLSGELARK